MEKRTKFSFIYYLIILAAIFSFETLLFSGPEIKEISYSEFRDLLATNKIEKVVIKQDKIIGLLKLTESKIEQPAQTQTAQKNTAEVPKVPEAKQQVQAKPENVLKQKSGWPKFLYPPWRLKLKQIEE